MRKEGDDAAAMLKSKELGLKSTKGAPFINKRDALWARILRIMTQYGDITAQS
jgi:hypothetical protein